MENFDLIDHVVPSGGWYCAIGIPPNKKAPPIHKFTESREELQKHFDAFADAGKHVYFGLAKYSGDALLPKDSGGGRKVKNAISFKSFWLDIDCGKGKSKELETSTGQPKGYENKPDAEAALESFCELVDLPPPTLVDSGNGWHAYWALDEELPKEQWLPISARLKQVCINQEFHVDPQVFDAARMLRVPGTLNLKFDPPSSVVVKRKAPPVSVEFMRKVLGVKATVPLATSSPQPNPAPGGGSTDPFELPSVENTLPATESSYSFKKIMQKGKLGCNQLIHAYQNRATLSEPMWWNALSIAQHCSDRDEAIHVLSKGHPDYDRDTVERKAANIKFAHSCETFAKEYPAGCKGCIHSKGADKIFTPKELGEDIKEDANPTFVLPPKYYRGEHGGIYTRNEKGIPIEVFKYDFYITERLQDTALGHVTAFAVEWPLDGLSNFDIPNEKLTKQDIRKQLSRNGLVVEDTQAPHLITYVLRYIKYLQTQKEFKVMHDQFGWKENYTKFVVGEKEIVGDDVYHTRTSSATQGETPHFHSKGTIEKWAESFELYNKPGMEVPLFAALTGFGSPLLEFTGQKGAVINLVHSTSGTGKTTILRMVNSVCGQPEMLLGSPDDKYLARMQKLGVLNNVAHTIDELTNLEADRISDFLYACSQGKGRERMESQKNANRINKTTWRAVTVTSNNAGFSQKLAGLKHQADGELMRLIEFNVPPSTIIPADIAAKMFDHQLMKNYGVAIVPFIQYVINNLDQVQKTLAEVKARIDKRCKLASRERNWSAILAVNFTAGIIIDTLGIAKVNTVRLFDVICPLVDQMKLDITPPKDNDALIMTEFLYHARGKALVVNSQADQRTGKAFAPEVVPVNKGKPHVRFEPDTRILYLPTGVFRQYCLSEQIDYTQLIKRYRKIGFCTSKEADPVAIDRGMDFTTGAVRCNQFDCNHPYGKGIDSAMQGGESNGGGESEVQS